MQREYKNKLLKKKKNKLLWLILKFTIYLMKTSLRPETVGNNKRQKMLNHQVQCFRVLRRSKSVESKNSPKEASRGWILSQSVCAIILFPSLPCQKGCIPWPVSLIVLWIPTLPDQSYSIHYPFSFSYLYLLPFCRILPIKIKTCSCFSYFKTKAPFPNQHPMSFALFLFFTKFENSLHPLPPLPSTHLSHLLLNLILMSVHSIPLKELLLRSPMICKSLHPTGIFQSSFYLTIWLSRHHTFLLFLLFF